MKNGPFINDVPLKTTSYRGFSIAMFDYQRVFILTSDRLNSLMLQIPCVLRVINSSSARLLGASTLFRRPVEEWGHLLAAGPVAGMHRLGTWLWIIYG